MSFDPNRAVYIDFETFPIGARPGAYPPVPAGLAIDIPGEKPTYYAWGHPLGGNTHTYEQARQALLRAYRSGLPLVYHHAKFDIEVTEEHFKLPRLKKSRYHDTMPMLFLIDPRADSYGLKQSAKTYLGWEPEERDAVEDWLIENQPVPGRKLSPAMKKDGKSNPDYAGAFIVYAPVKLVAPYALGDLKRTKALAKYCVKELRDRSMLEAYDRERDVLLVLLDREGDGVRVDEPRLARDVRHHSDEKEAIETWLRKRLGCSADINFDASAEVVDALLSAKLATKESLGVTPTGKVQTNKEALDRGVTDATVLSMMRYRAQLKTCLSTFMAPWLATAQNSDGLIYTQWHSTRHDHNDDLAGTRTGRLSSTPNFQNVPTNFKPHFYEDAMLIVNTLTRGTKEYKAALAFAKSRPRRPIPLSPMPIVRSYITPWADDDVLTGRDFAGQEFRIFAHYEDGVLKEGYLADPWMDPHAYVAGVILQLAGIDMPRKKVKNIGFGVLYGMGLEKLALSLESDIETAKQMKGYYYQALPNINNITDLIKARVREDRPIRTYGGREYYVEEPKWVDGRYRDYTYKLLNVLIQGSAADCTKIAFLNFERTRALDWRLILNVHDELVVSAPRKQMHEAMECLRIAMESVQFDVPMLSEGEWSDKNWAAMEVYDEKGQRKAA